MKAPTMLETIRSLLGVPACAIPLSVCIPARTYLLEKAGIPPSGTAILFPIPYVMTADINEPSRNLSLYAVPRDYHGYMRELEATVLPYLRESFPDNVFAFFSDHSPILEADAAAKAGLGVLGMNRLLITPDYGSFVFIGECITDADYESVTGEAMPEFPETPSVCEGCGACLAACPTGCFTGSSIPCLSAISQKKGDLTPTERGFMTKWGLAWGCDRCQLACPHNIRVIREGKDTPIPYFREGRLLHLDLNDLFCMDDESFSERAFSWRGRSVILRNLELFDSFYLGSDPICKREGRDT